MGNQTLGLRFWSSLVLSSWCSVTSLCADDSSTIAVQKTLSRLVEKNHGHGGGSIRIANTSGPLVQAAAGLTAGPGSQAMTPDTPFEIASITKTVTAATVLRLVEQGKLQLSSPLGELLPASVIRPFSPSLTLRELLSHTSGLPNYWTDGPVDSAGNNAFLQTFLASPNHVWTPSEILHFARQIPAKRPGSRFHYSDTNYVLLGLIIEYVTGQSLHHAYRKLIFEPLGMRSTWLTYHESARSAAPSHRYEGSEDLHEVPRQSADWAGGGLVSTNLDLERFLRGIASGKLFQNSESLELLKKSVPVGEADISYGLGLYRIRLDEGRGELWGHDGHGNSFAYYWPQQKITFTGTLNQTDNDWWPLIEAYLEGEEPTSLTATESAWDFSLSAGWDSLYLYRGVNALHDQGGYGSGIAWTELNAAWSLSESDFLIFDFWQAVATQGTGYHEFDASLTYSHSLGDFDFNLESAFFYGYSNGNFFSFELSPSISYTLELGPLTLTPSLNYAFNFGPDADDGYGFAKAGSSFLFVRLDASLPIVRNRITFEPWSALGVNFSYNTRDDADDEPQTFNGLNHFEIGLALRFQVTRHVDFLLYTAYSHALTQLTETDPNTFWSGAGIGF